MAIKTRKESKILDENSSSDNVKKMNISDIQPPVTDLEEFIDENQKELNIEEMARTKEIDIDKIKDRKKPKEISASLRRITC